ncbi:MAG TPA: Flp pilus assembly protein CpaB [Stellaceae bacterium]|nr:Flp pilus assembly protein CpaB [Stellaceae bacterium]
MRARSLILIMIAVLLAGGTAMLARSWLARQRAEPAQASPLALPAPAKSVLVTRAAIQRGQILRPDDLVWQPWPEGVLDKSYVLLGTRTPKDFAGSVARFPLGPGEPITDAKIVNPGTRGFLAAVLRPGKRAISVPITPTSGISGFIFPGDFVDILITETFPKTGGADNSPGQGQTDRKAAETVLHNVRVIGIDQRLEGKPGEAIVGHTATLEVTPKEGEIIELAAEMGKLSLVLRSLRSDGQPGEQDVADSGDVLEKPTYTLDSEVSQLLDKPTAGKEKNAPVSVTILRGGAKTDEAVASQPASKGS